MVSNDWFNVLNWAFKVPQPTFTVFINVDQPFSTVVGLNPKSGPAVANVLAIGALAGQTGNLTIQNGGVLNVGTDLSLGDDTGTGILTILSGSSVSAGNVSIGNVGVGTLTIQSGGTVSDGTGNIGNLRGSRGTVTVNGANATWTNTSNLIVGQNGTGELTIQNGGLVRVGGIVFIANLPFGTGMLNIGAAPGSGPVAPGKLETSKVIFSTSGSRTGVINFNHTATDYVFAPVISGSGKVNIFSGTTILTANNTYSLGTFFNGGILAVNSDANLGTGLLSFDGGTLEALAAITSAKRVTLNAGGGTFLADPGTDSTLSGVISGVGSFTKLGNGTLTLTGTSSYGGNTIVDGGTLNIQHGGTVTDSFGYIGKDSGTSGTVTVTDANATWTNTSSLFVGFDGTGTLNIQSGGTVSDAQGFIGLDPRSSGTVTVTGPNAIWTTTGILIVGGNGTGELTIQSGGLVQAGTVIIANSFGTGTLNIGAAPGLNPMAPGTLETSKVIFSNPPKAGCAWVLSTLITPVPTMCFRQPLAGLARLTSFLARPYLPPTTPTASGLASRAVFSLRGSRQVPIKQSPMPLAPAMSLSAGEP
jgi:T5SS/PEP-CTERM-associated repeat protein/autotransporter-associated beta strand protein